MDDHGDTGRQERTRTDHRGQCRGVRRPRAVVTARRIDAHTAIVTGRSSEHRGNLAELTAQLDGATAEDRGARGGPIADGTQLLRNSIRTLTAFATILEHLVAGQLGCPPARVASWRVPN